MSFGLWHTDGTLHFVDGNSNTPIAAQLNDSLGKPQIPIGGCVHWDKSMTGVPQTLPEGWIVCDGVGNITDADSPLNGQPVPDLNTTKRFIQGNSTSGGTGGADTLNWQHTHTTGTTTQCMCSSSSGATYAKTLSWQNAGSTSTDITPLYHEGVWLMRIK